MTAPEDGRDRCGVVLIGEQEISELFAFPAGMELLVAWADPATRAIKVLVRSDELDPVAPGVEAPILHGSWDRELQVDQDGKLWTRWRWA